MSVMITRFAFRSLSSAISKLVKMFGMDWGNGGKYRHLLLVDEGNDDHFVQRIYI